ncbi:MULTISPECIES: flagellar FliJ family protein [unclassified Duganella]|uniref:flagellar FliJ family protein n=1 Tax=unclassified Duganella TaxID=2636909 RepID=UPI0006F2FA6E|nr:MULTISPECIES: flagellar FliJ family protein [unclassified Duganella]KQV57995.1 hypothetical protein ASD07_26475 [Duganella sp. Root336D2]KRB99154.1 hypothetical protein ASE26_24675 [Duganella sp. Root198D2]
MKLRGFRYALEPVRLTRQWAVDGLAPELQAAAAELAVQQRELDRLQALAHAAQAEWNGLSQAGQAMPAERFAQLGRYLGDCRLRQAVQAQAVERTVQALEAVRQRMLAARRELDAVEEHRDEAGRQFLRQRQDGDIKAADELWNVLKSGRGTA